MRNYGNTVSTGPFHHFSQLLVLTGLVLLCATVFTLLGMLLAQTIYGVTIIGNASLLNNAATDPATLSALKLMQAFSSIGTFIVPAVLFCIMNKRNFADTTGIAKGFSLVALLLSISILLFATPLIAWMISINERVDLPESLQSMELWMKRMERDAEAITTTFLKMNSLTDFLVNLFVIAFLPAVCEEILFRGIGIPFFREWTGNTHLAIWIVGFTFSLVHMQFYGFLPRMMLGVLLGYLFVWSGSLWVPLIVHFTNNGLAVLMAYISDKPDIQGLEDVAESTPWYAFGSAVVVSGLLYLLFRNRVRPVVIRHEPETTDFLHLE